MAAPTEIRALYRAFLREMPPHRLLATPRSPLHAQLRAAFEQPSASSASSAASTSPSSSAASALTLPHGTQYLAYLQAQRTYATLLERYNPNLAGNMDEQERVRLSARRVGMNMPIEFGDDGKAAK